MLGTLAKVAVGAMIAKGVSGAMRGGGAGGGLGGLLGGAMGNAAGGRTGGGGLGGMLGGLAGGQQGGQQQGGGLGGLGGLLSGQQQGGQAGGAAGGLGGLLESLGGAQGGVQGGQEQQQPQQGGFGDLFNTALAGEPQPDPAAEQQAEIMLRAMLMAARADGQIDAAEQEKITGNLGDIEEDEANFIREEMANPTSLEAFVPTVPKGMEQQVYLMSLIAIDLDTQEEAQYLDKLAKSLNIDQATSNAIHAKVGAPPLYG